MSCQIDLRADVDARGIIADCVDLLLGLLDVLDGDADLEDDDVDLEDGNDREGIDDDREPSLGTVEGIDGDEAALATAGAGDDTEYDPVDDEPSLGSLDKSIDQSRWAFGDRRDIEETCDDEGAEGDNGLGDADGRAEQGLDPNIECGPSRSRDRSLARSHAIIDAMAASARPVS